MSTTTSSNGSLTGVDYAINLDYAHKVVSVLRLMGDTKNDPYLLDALQNAGFRVYNFMAEVDVGDVVYGDVLYKAPKKPGATFKFNIDKEMWELESDVTEQEVCLNSVYTKELQAAIPHLFALAMLCFPDKARVAYEELKKVMPKTMDVAGDLFDSPDFAEKLK